MLPIKSLTRTRRRAECFGAILDAASTDTVDQAGMPGLGETKAERGIQCMEVD